MSKINDLEQEVKADVKEATEAVSAENADKPWFKRLSLTTWIFIALALGVVAGSPGNDKAAVAYATVYPLSMFLRVVLAQVLIMVLMG